MLRDLSGGDGARFADLAALGGFDPVRATFRVDSPIIGGDIPEFATAWAARLGVPFDDGFVARVDALFRAASLRSLTPYDDVGAALDRLAAAGIAVGLATNDSEANARAHLDSLGLRGRFGFVAGFDSGFGGKPEPGMVSAFAAHLGVAPPSVVMVGDSPHDIEAARRAGARAIGIAREPRAALALGTAPDRIVATLAELLDHLGVPTPASAASPTQP